jgi:hypothetical protein
MLNEIRRTDKNINLNFTKVTKIGDHAWLFNYKSKFIDVPIS